MAPRKKKTPTMVSSESTVSVPDWSLLPVELLHIISKKVEDCFDVVHARSVCTLWRSIFPFPSHLSRPSYTLPTPREDPPWSLEKIPLFLFRPRALAASEFFLGGIGRYEPEEEEEEELPSPIQCSVKVEIPGSSDPRLINMLDCQILPLGHQYRMIGCNAREYRNVAVLHLNHEGEGGGDGDFVVLLNFTRVLFVLRSSEMKWRRLQPFTMATCEELFTFRGKFYAIFINGDVFAFDPHFQGLTHLKPLELPNCGSCNDLVQSGDDELFLVEQILPRNDDVFDFHRLALRVCRLDVEAGQWVVATDIGDRVFIIGDLGNVSCSAKEFPDGCGVSGNSILYTNMPWKETYFYKYGVDTGREEDDRNCWWYSRENLVTILSTSPVVALRVERSNEPNVKDIGATSEGNRS
ncbi:F-box/kelch-repeat protein At1g64840-like isoform X2 [Raphanus sativus]|uniref:F-box/kelch-repeat protein At1g64840-like isoform X2 n=1 Tax=Raphanus sativus TaxID=3726 RepID=A0A9W3DFY9_RAPSA|nr:F-box/kelch-repeat protein At1g64840-like isoform X2 [Raphanus sativus]